MHLPRERRRTTSRGTNCAHRVDVGRTGQALSTHAQLSKQTYGSEKYASASPPEMYCNMLTVQSSSDFYLFSYDESCTINTGSSTCLRFHPGTNHEAHPAPTRQGGGSLAIVPREGKEANTLKGRSSTCISRTLHVTSSGTSSLFSFQSAKNKIATTNEKLLSCRLSLHF